MTKYTYFWQGKAVRNSDREYAFGVTTADGDTVRSCHATERAAKMERTREINEARQRLGNYERAIKAREDGRSHYRAQIGRTIWQQKLKDSDTVPELTKWMEAVRGQIERAEKRQVVRLERRVNY